MGGIIFDGSRVAIKGGGACPKSVGGYMRNSKCCGKGHLYPRCGVVDSVSTIPQEDLLDLMRDEFFRIRAITTDSEIRGLCVKRLSG